MTDRSPGRVWVWCVMISPVKCLLPAVKRGSLVTAISSLFTGAAIRARDSDQSESIKIHSLHHTYSSFSWSNKKKSSVQQCIECWWSHCRGSKTFTYSEILQRSSRMTSTYFFNLSQTKTPASLFTTTPSPLFWIASIKWVRPHQNTAQSYLTQ